MATKEGRLSGKVAIVTGMKAEEPIGALTAG